MSDPTSPKRARALSRLRAREPVFGLLQTMPGPTVTELAVWSGFDFVILDCEHGVVDERAHLASLQAIAGSDGFALVRVRPGDLGAVGRYLDFGADGIIMPDLRTKEDATAFVAAATFGPEGTRSSTGNAVRAGRYGLVPRPERESPLLLGIIESEEAVANVTTIAATQGLDGFIIGPHDLAASLDCAGNFSAPAYTAAFAAIEQTATKAELLLGSIAHPGFPIARLLGAGHRFIIASVDILALRDGVHAQLEAAKGGAT